MCNFPPTCTFAVSHELKLWLTFVKKLSNVNDDDDDDDGDGGGDGDGGKVKVKAGKGG